jgi:hypothetical protein
VLLRPTASASALSAQLIAFARAVPRPSAADVRAFIARETLGKGAGFVGDAPHGGAATHEEVERVLQSIKETTPDGGEHASASFVPPINTADEARKVIADCISRRAEVGWSTSEFPPSPAERCVSSGEGNADDACFPPAMKRATRASTFRCMRMAIAATSCAATSRTST